MLQIAIVKISCHRPSSGYPSAVWGTWQCQNVFKIKQSLSQKIPPALDNSSKLHPPASAVNYHEAWHLSDRSQRLLYFNQIDSLNKENFTAIGSGTLNTRWQFKWSFALYSIIMVVGVMCPIILACLHSNLCTAVHCVHCDVIMMVTGALSPAISSWPRLSPSALCQ